LKNMSTDRDGFLLRRDKSMTDPFGISAAGMVTGTAWNAPTLVFVVILLVWLAYDKMAKMRQQTEIYRVAQRVTKEFYAGADMLLEHGGISEPLKEFLYDMLLVTTCEPLGRRMLKYLADALGGKWPEERIHENRIYKEMF